MCLELHLNLVFDLDLDPGVNLDFDYDINFDNYNCFDLNCSLDPNIKFNL